VVLARRFSKHWIRSILEHCSVICPQGESQIEYQFLPEIGMMEPQKPHSVVAEGIA